MEYIHIIAAFVYYGFGFTFLVFEVIHFSKKKHQEKKLAMALDNLNKFFDKNP